MSERTNNSNYEKSAQQKTTKKLLTVFPNTPILIKALASLPAHQRVLRQITGGKEEIQQPPHVSGFFVSVSLSGDNNSLPRGYGIKKRSRVNTCGGLPVSHLRTRGSFKTVSAKTLDNQQELPAMNANTHGTATPVAAKSGTRPSQCNHCLLPASVLSDAITQAKAETTQCKCCTGRAYPQLLKYFHAAILPTLITETGGNITKMSRLLGIHRSSVIKYAQSVGLYHLLGAGQGGAKL